MSPAMGVLLSQNYHDRHIPHRLGCWLCFWHSNIEWGCHILVRTVNMTVVLYLNSLGGLRSRPLQAGEVCPPWGRRPRMLHPQVVSLIWQRFGRAEVDLFALSMTTHCPLWVSLSPLGVDALAQEWPRTRHYAFPPIWLLSAVLLRVRSDEVRHLLMVAPFWPAQIWFSDLVSLLVGPLWEVPLRPNLLTQAQGMIGTPVPIYGNCGCGPWAADINVFWSLGWDCRHYFWL